MTSDLSFSLPHWLDAAAWSTRFAEAADPPARMRLVAELAVRNVDEGSGGPFAAAVIDDADAKLIGLGVNRVVPEGLSMLHAEMVALAYAQRRLASHDLGHGRRLALYSSCEPCAMCLGAIPWSGVTRVYTGALDVDARAVGFDEGLKPTPWQRALTSRGIELIEGLERQACVAAFARFGALSRSLY